MNGNPCRCRKRKLNGHKCRDCPNLRAFETVWDLRIHRRVSHTRHRCSVDEDGVQCERFTGNTTRGGGVEGV